MAQDEDKVRETLVSAMAPDLEMDECVCDREIDPCTITILGATGDLASRKLIPALYSLFLNGGMPETFAIVGTQCKMVGRPPTRRTSSPPENDFELVIS